MKIKIKSKMGIYPLLFSLIIIVLSIGCTSTTYRQTIGSNPNMQDSRVISAGQLKKMRLGTNVELTFKSDHSISGKYAGFERLEPDDYRILFLENLSKKHFPMTLPVPGDDILVEEISGKVTPSILIGLDYKQICYRPVDDTLIQNQDLSEIDVIRFGDNGVIEGSSLSQLTVSGNLPLMSAIAIEDNRFRNLIAVHETNSIVIKPSF